MVIVGVLLPLMQALVAGLLAVFLIGALIAVDPVVALLTASAVGSIYGLISLFTRRRLRANSRAIAAGQNRRIQTVQDGLGGIRDVIIDQTRGHFAERFNAVERTLRDAQAGTAFINAFPRVIIEAVGMVFIALLAYILAAGSGGVAAALPILGALALGAQRLLPLLQQVYSGWTLSTGNRQALLDVLGLLDEPLSAVLDIDKCSEMPPPRLIEFAGVGFRYTATTSWVVRDLSLSIPRGARVGIVGKTGSGKSTVMDLLMGLLEPTEGAIKIDGRTLDEGGRRAWQRQIAHVPQAIYLSDASIAENIAFGTDHNAIDMECVREAARRAELQDFIEALPDGYATFVGERGVRLSGGQRQRIGIARALYKKASVIVFDEATSALDSQTEAAVMQSIFDLREDLTVFIIAHRLSTVEGCWPVVSLSDGRIDRIGTYDEVIRATPPEGPVHAR
jgi:ATP-binding cassette subfamily B protein